MKKMFYLSISLILIYLSGCSEGIIIQKSMVGYSIDFTKYSKIGFLFTPEKYNGNYESVGLIQVEFFPSVKPIISADWTNGKYVGGWFADPVTSSEIIDSVYNICKKMGANALTDFNVSFTEPKSNGEITYYGIKVGGFAIKR